MCNPALALLAFTAAVSYVGQTQAADAAADAAQAQGEQINRQAGQEQDAASARADQIRKAAARQVSESRAAFSASGVAADTGSPLKVAEEITRGGEYDALNAILSGNRLASSMGDESDSIVRQGNAQRRAGYTQAYASVLSSAASGASGAGWRTGGAGFSGTQNAAPITDRMSGNAGYGDYANPSFIRSIRVNG